MALVSTQRLFIFDFTIVKIGKSFIIVNDLLIVYIIIIHNNIKRKYTFSKC